MDFFTARMREEGDAAKVMLDGASCPPLPAHEQRAERKGGTSVIVPVGVEMDEPTGRETLLMARISGQDAIIVCDPDEAPGPGEMMDFAIDMAEASVFDPMTEYRLWLTRHITI